ncbi:MAG: tRNA (adenosine(37)-N6)-dimethylallyltransferase MiaA, partial [Clostridia bacterium]|nr:tRNA (adenosine(37)-N6)-dimethylallyltransferase MiaA [Clostridia bacterium]
FEHNATAAQAIGYKELLGALRGEMTLDDAIDSLKLATRHYAKRQMTWFNAKPYVRWIFADTEDGVMRERDDVIGEALALCREVGL